MVAVELQMVALAAIVLFIHLFLAAGVRMATFGPAWAGGARDSTPGTVSLKGQRCDRAFRNMAETFPIFSALAIGVVAAGLSNDTTVLGSELYVIARILYLPAYVFHVPYVRSIVYAVAIAGILMTGAPLFGAVLF